MTYSSRLSALCDKIIETGWLAAVVLAPLYFNIYSSRVFEPDKITLLRSIALIMVAAWIVRLIEERGAGRAALGGVGRRTPLILPAFILVVVYIVATILSVAPATSLLGSYQRLQGTYSTFSYIVVFLMIVMNMRRRRQLDRLVTAVVITSLPIAFYGVLQRVDRDPLPWGGDVTQRVAANAGNAIFVAAYLIMAFFLTLGRVIEAFRVILTEEESRISDILRASAYIFVGAVQLIAFAFAGSRGPLLGWLPGMFVLGLVGLLMLRVATHRAENGAAASGADSATQTGGLPNQVVGTFLRLGLRLILAGGVGLLFLALFSDVSDNARAANAALSAGLFGLALLIVMARAESGEKVTAVLVWQDVFKAAELSLYALAVAAGVGLHALSAFPGPAQFELAAVAAVIGGLVPLLVFAGTRRGAARWLWASWIFFVILGAVGLFGINFSDHPRVVELRQAGAFGTLGTLFESESGTGKVRSLIWQGAVDLIQAHAPITFPDGTSDPLNPLRFLIGYGPESMYVAYNRFYPPDLAHYEARNASPDRSHNETWDSFVITGAAGFVAEQFLFLSVFFFALKFVGWVPSRRAAITFVAMMVVGGVAGAAALERLKGIHFAGAGWPGGVTAGLVLYVILFALFHFRISRSIYILIAAFLLLIVDAAIFGVTFASANRLIEMAAATAVGAIAFAVLYGIGRWAFDDTAEQPIAMSGHVFLIIALVGGMLAHYLEISLAGIAIGATRTYFWTFAGMLVVAGLNWVPADDAEPAPASRPESAPSPKPQAANPPRGKKRRAAVSRPEPRTSITRTPAGWLGPTVAAALVGALVLVTLGFNFITTPPVQDLSQLPRNATDVLVRSLTTLPYKTGAPSSPGVLLMFLVTWVFGGIVSLTDLRRRNVLAPASVGSAAATYFGVSIGVAFAYWMLHASTLLGVVTQLLTVNTAPASNLDEYVGRFTALAESMAGLLGLFYAAMLAVVLGTAFSLLGETRTSGLRAAGEWGLLASVPALAAALALTIAVNVNPIRADIIYKQGQPYVANNACNGAGNPETGNSLSQCDVAIAHLKTALAYAPDEDFYMLALGASFLNKSAGAQDGAPLLIEGSTYGSILGLDAERTAQLNRRDALMAARVTLEHARQINPLNTDHSANLARLHRRWSDLAAGPDERRLRLDQASDFYRQATALSPNNAQLWNEWAVVFFSAYDLARQLSDAAAQQAALQEAEARLDESLSLDREFSDTYIYLATLYTEMGRPEEAQTALSQALQLNPNDPQAWARLTEQMLASGSYTNAETLTVEFLNRNPDFLSGWRVLARRIYFPQGKLAEAIGAAQRAVEVATLQQDTGLWEDELALAELLRLGGNPAAALPFAQAAFDAAPPDRKADAQAVLDAINAMLSGSAPPPTPVP